MANITMNSKVDPVDSSNNGKDEAKDHIERDSFICGIMDLDMQGSFSKTTTLFGLVFKKISNAASCFTYSPGLIFNISLPDVLRPSIQPNDVLLPRALETFRKDCLPLFPKIAKEQT